MRRPNRSLILKAPEHLCDPQHPQAPGRRAHCALRPPLAPEPSAGPGARSSSAVRPPRTASPPTRGFLGPMAPPSPFPHKVGFTPVLFQLVAWKLDFLRPMGGGSPANSKPTRSGFFCFFENRVSVSPINRVQFLSNSMRRSF